MTNNTKSLLHALHDLLDSGFTISGALFAIASSAPDSMLSKNAEHILCSMKRGYGFSEALIGSGLLPNKKTHALIQGTSATGNPGIAVQLILTNDAEENEFKNNIISSLVYPAFVILLSTVLVFFVGFYAIPFAELSETQSTINSREIFFNVFITLFSSLIAAIILGICTIRIIGNQTFRTRYWQLVHALTSAEIQLDTCFLECEKALHIPSNHVDKRLRLDSFSSSILTAMMHSGDVKTAIASITSHYRSKLELTIKIIERVSAPAAILIAGLTLFRLALTIFIPILAIAGGL